MMNIAILAKITLCAAIVTLGLIGTPMQAHAGGPHVKVFDVRSGETISVIDTTETPEQITAKQEDESTNERPSKAYFVNVDHGTTTQ